MSGQTGKWREDQILVICPGSKTTMAQLGCGELTPPTYRLPTRVFKDDESDDYRPYFAEKRRKIPPPQEGAKGESAADEWEYIEDPDVAEGAIYPMRAGRIVNMNAFLAFLEHVHSMLTTTYHNTPIMLMASPQWTRPDCESIARYIFEKTKTPALCLINSAVATQYGLRWPNMTVVDVGFEKVDVTCIFDSRVVNHREVGDPIDGTPGEAVSGGEIFTRKLQQLLADKEFSYEMSEQLKRSNICEVLPYAPEAPELVELPKEHAATVATVPPPSAVLQAAQDTSPTATKPPQPTITTTNVDEDGAAGEEQADGDDGVLDVASIVTSGQTKEFLAKKEKEKAEKAEKAKARKAGKGQDGDGQAPKPVRLPNSKRVRNTFHYEELVREDVPALSELGPQKPAGQDSTAPTAAAPADQAATPPQNGSAAAADGAGGTDGATDSTASAAAPATTADANGSANASASAPAAPAAPVAPKPDEPLSFFPSGDPTSAPVALSSTERPVKRMRRDIEVGLERFKFADRAEIDRIVTAIYQAVQGIEDMYMRPACWENIVFVGNGCRIRGLRENILQTLNARHLVSPSTATMFTSELPSNLGTPQGTGAQTPTAGVGFTGPPHQLPTSSSNVNQLLKEATTAAALGLAPGGGGAAGGGQGGPGTNPPGSNAGDFGPGGAHSTHFHSQTPTAIKLAALPNYLGEWTKNGYEEAMFLGAQVAARLAFCVHNMSAAELESQRLMSLHRVDYNEHGPKAIRSHSMLG